MAAKLNGLYYMFWGEGTLRLATSSNLLDWKPFVNSGGELLGVLTIRPGKFDSALVEPGPPAILTPSGIVLIYNGKNADKGGDSSVAPGAYCAGQALFDRNHPDHLLARTDSYFLKPEIGQEITGQYKAGTVFTEGLAILKGRWYLYFGAADSYVGVAASKQ